MFVQVIHGRARDAEGLRRQAQRWIEELKPGAEGFLGTTGGVSEDGTAVFVARFGSEEAARTNSDRPEQDAWWKETSQLFDGEVHFHDSTDVELMGEGGSDAAGFVQVIHGRATDPDRAREMDAEQAGEAEARRPDVIGGVTAWHEGGLFTSVVYFTSEEEARRGESSMADEDDGSGERTQEWASLFEDVTYIDLRDPWMG